MKVNMEVIVKKGSPIKLTMDEWKELYGKLHELFGKDTVTLPSQPVYLNH